MESGRLISRHCSARPRCRDECSGNQKDPLQIALT